jgi:hypothetical protein
MRFPIRAQLLSQQDEFAVELVQTTEPHFPEKEAERNGPSQINCVFTREPT